VETVAMVLVLVVAMALGLGVGLARVSGQVAELAELEQLCSASASPCTGE
jgi:hypothetical protein